MDYFKQRRAYRQWKQNEGSIARGQNDVYRELLDYANDEGHLDGFFKLRNSALVDWTGLSLQGVIKARNDLVNFGLIEYKAGVKNKSTPSYKIKRLYYTKTPSSVEQECNNQLSESVTTGSPKVEQPVEHKDLLVPDSDLTKNSSSRSSAGDPLQLWQQVWGFPNAIATGDIMAWRQEHGDELVTWAIEYAARHNVSAKGANRYIDRIMDRFTETHVATVAEAEEQTKAHENQVKADIDARKAAKPRYGKQPRKETKPPWMDKDYQPPKPEISDKKRAELNAKLASLNSDTEPEGASK